MTAWECRCHGLFCCPDFSRVRQRKSAQKDSDGVPDTVTERPTFAQAFASDAAAVSVPATPSTESTPAVSASADATVPPAEAIATEATPVSPTDGKAVDAGPIPLQRHKEILDGAYKERDGFKSQLDELNNNYGWARSVPREQFTQIAQTQQRLATDPVGFVRELIAELRDHETFGPQFRSEAARLLASGRQTPAVDFAPDIEVLSPQGQVVGKSFSAEKVQALVDHAVQQAIGKHVMPLQQERDQRIASEKQRSFDSAVQQQADTVMGDVYDILGVADPQKPTDEQQADLTAVGQALEANPKWSVERAAKHVYTTVIRPRDTAKTKADTLAELKTKAAASSMNPAAASVSTTTRPKSFHDPALKW